MQLHETVMGRQLLDRTFPSMATSLERIADALDRIGSSLSSDGDIIRVRIPKSDAQAFIDSLSIAADLLEDQRDATSDNGDAEAAASWQKDVDLLDCISQQIQDMSGKEARP